MAHEPLKIQISLTEWLEGMEHPLKEQFREEDNSKRDRMELLSSYIDFPYDKPVRFLAREVVDATDSFNTYLQEHSHEICAMRLLPIDNVLPKLRSRGQTIKETVGGWFKEQKIEPDKYKVEFLAHPQTHFWSTIFVVNDHGIFGEAIAESHQYVSQGFYTDIKPIRFAFNFKTWNFLPNNVAAEAHVKDLVKFLHVPDKNTQSILQKDIKSDFAHDYLMGYFESVYSELGIQFIDYNRTLGELYKDFTANYSIGELTGVVGCRGFARGRVRIVTDPAGVQLATDEILVCDMTTPEFLPLMKQSAAIIADRGGMLCHAVITARELGKPCIVGVGNATRLLHDGDVVEVDAERGVVMRC